VPCERRVGHVGLVGKGRLTRGFPVGVVGGLWGQLEILRTPSGLPALSHLGNQDRTEGLSMPGSPRSKTGLGPTRDTHPVAVASRQSAGDLHRMVVVAACCLDLLRERRHASASGDHGCATGVPSRPETHTRSRRGS